ncbi:MAG: hypothetical protein ABWK15_09400 [Dissulfuribacterales bacterium]
MLREFLTHLLTPAPPHIKEMGYLHELIAISERHKRCRRAWQPHLDFSKDFILQAVNLCADRNKAVILGSGLLLDIPLAELSNAFEEVLLVDIFHLSDTRRTASKYSNVFLLNADIAGIAHSVYRHRSIIPVQKTTGFPGCDFNTSLVISANILSQLSLCPASFLLKKCHASETDLQNWAKTLVNDHLKRLANLNCTVCLITDHSIIYRDKTGKISAEEDTLHGIKPRLKLPGIQIQKEWQWEMATLGEISRYYSVTLKVMGVIRSK